MTSHNNPADTLLIFDLDGTLCRTESSFVPTMRAISDDYGVAYAGDAAVMGQVGETYPDFLTWLTKQGFPSDIDALGTSISQREIESIQQSGELYPDVDATLRSLKQVGYRLAICTNGDMNYTSTVLGKFDLLKLFDAIKTHGDARQSKTVMIAELLNRFRPAHAFMIGDRTHDFVAGRANGCTVIAAIYGFIGDREAVDIDARLERFADLLRVIEQYLGD